MAFFNGSKFASLSNSIVTLYFPAFVGSIVPKHAEVPAA